MAGRTGLHACHSGCMHVTCRRSFSRMTAVRELPSNRLRATLARGERAPGERAQKAGCDWRQRGSARAKQRQDYAMTPAGPVEATAAPSKAARCACVADGASLSTEQDDCSIYRARDTLPSERAREIAKWLGAWSEAIAASRHCVGGGRRGGPRSKLAVQLDPESSRRAAGPSPRSPAALPVSSAKLARI